AMAGQYFSINAAVGPDGPKDVEGLTKALPALMKSLLEDRFKFSAHLETRTQRSYSVTVVRPDGRLGPGLRRSSADCPARRQHPTPDAPACGFQFTDSGMKIVGTSMDAIAALANSGSGRLFHVGIGGLPMKNDTNLDGLFDAEVDLSAEIR